MAKEASYQATISSRRAADAAREAARVQKTAIREATEAEKLARKENTDAARQAAEAARQRAEQAKREYEQQAHAAKKAREAELRAKEAAHEATRAEREAIEAAKQNAQAQKETERLARERGRVEKETAREAERAAKERQRVERETAREAERTARERQRVEKEAAREQEKAQREVEKAARRAAEEQKKAAQEAAKAQEALTGKIKGLIASYISLQSVAKLTQLSDEYSSINAKLGMMEDRLESTKAMQDAIMTSAKRSRASYMDTANLITRLGTMASDAFDSFDELVAFSEQINKNLVLSGASASEASAATQQLSQALASGALQGDELRSILEEAPMIAERIADYLDVNKGKIRELASEGLITAEIVKNAMFETAEKTNEAFKNMPMTWAQVWTEVTNTFIEYSQPLLEVISFLAQHFDALIPIIAGVSGALLAYVAIQGAVALATAISTIATQGLWATLMANPIAWIAVAIGIIIALIVKWVQKIGSLKVAWLIAVDKMMTAGDYLINFFRKVGEAIVLVVAGIGAVIAEIVQNAVNGAIRNINSLIQKANSVIGLVNSIPGIPDIPNIPLIPEVGFGDAAMDGVGKLAGYFDSVNADAIKKREDKHRARLEEIERAKSEAVSSSNGDNYDDLYGYLSEGIPNGQSLLGDGTGKKGKNGGSGGTGKGISSSGGGGSLGKIASDTSDIKKSVEMTHEDLSLLVDMATRKYVANVNLETRAPVINITGQNTGDSEADAMRIADQLKRVLLEQMSSGGSLSYALP